MKALYRASVVAMAKCILNQVEYAVSLHLKSEEGKTALRAAASDAEEFAQILRQYAAQSGKAGE